MLQISISNAIGGGNGGSSTPPSGDWILDYITAGIWADLGIWDDAAVWID